jgi:hypothetical protein
MNKFTKRILLANDVIQQLDSGRLSAFTGLLLSNRTERILSNKTGQADGKGLQAKVCSLKKCEACANGSLFLAYIGRFNTVTTIANIDYENVQTETPLADVFDHEDLDEIEYLFEGYNYSWHGAEFTRSQLKKMNDFRVLVLGDSRHRITNLTKVERNTLLRAIMEQLIENDGRKVIL